MKALLLAAGVGSRLRPLTDHLPKCLAPIRGVPLLAIWLHRLAAAGIDDIVLNTHHHAGLVERFVSQSPWNDRVTLAHEPTLLGTAGTMLRHAERFEGAHFLVAHADNLSLFEVRAFENSHRQRPARCEMTMMTFATPTPESCGIVETDREGVVVAFHEKVANPPGNRANAAVYIFEPGVLAVLRALGGPCIDLSTEVIPGLVRRIATFENATYHRDIGTVRSLAEAQADFPCEGDEPPFGRAWLADQYRNDPALRKSLEDVFGAAVVTSWDEA